MTKWEYFKSKCKQLFHYPTWPLMDLGVLKSIQNKTIEILDKETFDIIVCVYGGVTPIIIGHRLKKRIPNIKFVAYFLDAFFHGAGIRPMPSWYTNKVALIWERRLLNNADGIVKMKSVEPAYKNLKEAFLKRTAFLDIPLYVPFEYSPEKQYFPKEQTALFFAGTMPQGIRPPYYFLELFHAVDDPSMHLYLAGSSDYIDVLKDYAAKDSRIHILGTLPHDQVASLLKEADYLLNIGNNLTNMVPCKIFEYMSYKKPIISTFRIDEDTCCPYLRTYRNSFLIDERLDINKNVCLFTDFLHNKKDESINSNSFQLNKPSTVVEYILK
jgi:glycosyltransferase involved in cell wall biosynthesis